MKKIIQFTICLSLLFISQGCEKEGFESKVSSHDNTKSHNTGENCMACHTKGGEGEGNFQMSGTVYNDILTSIYANTTVKLYTGPNGTGDLKYTVEGDAKGNFYTTKKIKFKDGLYPSITGNSGTKYMSSTITTGNCISCHGNTTAKLWVD